MAQAVRGDLWPSSTDSPFSASEVQAKIRPSPLLIVYISAGLHLNSEVTNKESPESWVMEEKLERDRAACEMRVQWGRRSRGSRLRTKTWQIQAGISEQTLMENTGPNMCNGWECWKSGVAHGGQHMPLGCVMFATIDSQFGFFFFWSK